MRSKVANNAFSNFRSQDQSCVYKNVHKIESLKKHSVLTFVLMKNLLVTSAIMRSKVYMQWWLIIRAKNKPQLQIYIQWKPLNVITDNVIIRLMLSVFQSPIPIGKNRNKIFRLL